MENKEKNKKAIAKKTGSNRELKRQDVYHEFVLWTAMPPQERGKLGINTQGEFCQHYNLSHNMPARWKERPEFIRDVTELRRQWAFEKTGDVIQGIYLAALKGNPFSQKLWLQYFLGFTEKQEVTTTKAVEIGSNDIRFLIDGLPEPEKTKFHGYITEIIDYANKIRNARDVADDIWADSRPADEIFEETDNDASDVPDERTYEVPRRHSTSVREDMGDQTRWPTPTSSYHYQSAAQWW